MRHFKYPFIKNVNKKVFKERLSLLSKKSKRNYYITKVFNFSNFILYITLITVLILLYKQISIDGNMNKVLQTFIQILVIIGIIFIPSIICLTLLYYYLKLFPYDSPPKLERESLNKCTIKFTKYYKLNENYIITKCYYCTNELLINKDVFLFFINNKLRIINDFNSSIKDFGCYEISINEITCEYEEHNKLLSTSIKCNNFVVILGKRAKPFIKRNLLN